MGMHEVNWYTSKWL